MNDKSKMKLVRGLLKRPSLSGWVFSYEYPGFFAYSKGDLTVACTPDDDTENVVSA